jgi:deoxyribodipyrimidine photo-lyase
VLAESAPAQDGAENPAPRALPAMAPFDPEAPSVLVLHEEDLTPDLSTVLARPPLGAALLPASTGQSPLSLAPQVLAFRTGLLEDAAARLAPELGALHREALSAPALEAWAQSLGAAQIITPWAPVGPTAECLAGITALPVHRLRRGWDSRAWPRATAGYFKFRKAIPDLLAALD